MWLRNKITKSNLSLMFQLLWMCVCVSLLHNKECSASCNFILAILIYEYLYVAKQRHKVFFFAFVGFAHREHRNDRLLIYYQILLPFIQGDIHTYTVLESKRNKKSSTTTTNNSPERFFETKTGSSGYLRWQLRKLNRAAKLKLVSIIWTGKDWA